MNLFTDRQLVCLKNKFIFFSLGDSFKSAFSSKEKIIQEKENNDFETSLNQFKDDVKDKSTEERKVLNPLDKDKKIPENNDDLSSLNETSDIIDEDIILHAVEEIESKIKNLPESQRKIVELKLERLVQNRVKDISKIKFDERTVLVKIFNESKVELSEFMQQNDVKEIFDIMGAFLKEKDRLSSYGVIDLVTYAKGDWKMLGENLLKINPKFDQNFIKSFQKLIGSKKPDGKMGPFTLNALNEIFDLGLPKVTIAKKTKFREVKIEKNEMLEENDFDISKEVAVFSGYLNYTFSDYKTAPKNERADILDELKFVLSNNHIFEEIDSSFMLDKDKRELKSSVKNIISQFNANLLSETLLHGDLTVADNVKISEAIKFCELSEKDNVMRSLKKYSNYLSIIESSNNISVKWKNGVDIPNNVQDYVIKIISDFSIAKMLAKENVLLHLDSTPELIKGFYRGNKLLKSGNVNEAEKEYDKFLKSFVKHVSKSGVSRSDVFNVPEFKRAHEIMRQLSRQKINTARAKLELFRKALKNTSRGWSRDSGMDGKGWNNVKIMLDAQELNLNLIEKVLNADNALYKFEDVVAYMRNMKFKGGEEGLLNYRKKDNFGEVFKYYKKIGVRVSRDDVQYSEYEHGGMLDVIETENGLELSREDLLKRAAQYEDADVYELAESDYDLAFRDIYKQFSEKYPFDKFKNQSDIKEKISEMMRGKKNVKLENYLLKKEWKRYLQVKITASVNDGDLPKIKEGWDDFNDAILQADREWYHILSFTDREWDNFLESLPAELFVLAVTGGASSAVKGAVTKGITRKIVAEIVLKEVLQTQGRRAALKYVAKKVGIFTVGLLVESVVATQTETLMKGFVSGDISDLSNFDKYKESFYSTVLSLGVMKGSGKIAKIPAKFAGRVAGHVAVEGIVDFAGDMSVGKAVENLVVGALHNGDVSSDPLANASFLNIDFGNTIVENSEGKDKGKVVENTKGKGKDEIVENTKDKKKNKELASRTTLKPTDKKV